MRSGALSPSADRVVLLAAGWTRRPGCRDHRRRRASRDQLGGLASAALDPPPSAGPPTTARPRSGGAVSAQSAAPHHPRRRPSVTRHRSRSRTGSERGPPPARPRRPAMARSSAATEAVGSYTYVFPVQGCQVELRAQAARAAEDDDLGEASGCGFVAPDRRHRARGQHRVDPLVLGDRPRRADREGQFVTIIGDDGVRYLGGHLDSVAAGIKPGVKVKAGQVLGRSATPATPPARRRTCTSRSPGRPPATYWWVRRGMVNPVELPRRLVQRQPHLLAAQGDARAAQRLGARPRRAPCCARASSPSRRCRPGPPSGPRRSPSRSRPRRRTTTRSSSRRRSDRSGHTSASGTFGSASRLALHRAAGPDQRLDVRRTSQTLTFIAADHLAAGAARTR